jgi:hypothetical protein
MTTLAADREIEALMALHPKGFDLSLDRISRLLERLDNPQDRLPPVIHIAGTNGKGFVRCLFARPARGGGLPRPCPHLAASGQLARALPAGRRWRRQAGRGQGFRRCHRACRQSQ